MECIINAENIFVCITKYYK